jgi:methylthioribose-1-phosphate isomerase
VNVAGVPHRTVRLDGDAVVMIDQKLLPWRFEHVVCRTAADTAEAIRDMTVRGAGAIGATGAFAAAQAVIEAARGDRFEAEVAETLAMIAATRPTAQNLFAGIDAVRAVIDADPRASVQRAIRAANAFADADADACRRIGEHGRSLFRDGMRISTHCNAGWLAFVDWGSALSPIYALHRAGARVFVWVDETRPRGQGARLTAWELAQEGVPHAVLTDGVVGGKMRAGEVDAVIVGADRIAANGDVANKVGTYALAVLAKHHGVPFYVAAPTTTIDGHCPTGAEIPIEHRSEDEVWRVTGPTDSGELRTVRVVSAGSPAMNPAFDVTPAELVTAILTETGVHAPSQLRG